MKKFWKTAVALLAVGVIGIGATACSFELEKPEWLDQALCDHVFDEQIVLSEATCEDAGELMKICSDCGKTKTVAIKKLSHVDEDGDNRCDACDELMEIGEVASEVEVKNGDFLKSGWYRFYAREGGSTIGILKDEDGSATFQFNANSEGVFVSHILTIIDISEEFEMVHSTSEGAPYTDIYFEIPKEIVISGKDSFTFNMTSGWTFDEVEGIYYLEGK